MTGKKIKKQKDYLILKEAQYKSIEWATEPVVAESLFREYDLRSPIWTLNKGGKAVLPGINADGIRVLGQAYGTYAQNVLKQKKIVIGNDYRSYSRGMAYAFMTGVMSTGVDVVDIGVVATPTLYFAQYFLKFTGAAMITASHNDNGWCGLKLAKGFSRTFEPDDIVTFKKSVYAGKFKRGSGKYERLDINEAYIAEVVKRCKPYPCERKLKVVVSTANGGAGIFLPEVLKRLGFDIIKVNCDLDWDFPNFNPNTEDIKFLKQLGDAVKQHKADLGVGSDGDGDRFGVVNEEGHEIFSDRAGLFIARFISEQEKGKPIVIDVKSTGAYLMDPVLKKNGITLTFSKTGHSYVKAKTREVNALAGFERSGHFFLREPFGHGYDDACLSAALFCTILSRQKKLLSALIAEQPKSHQSPTMEPAVENDKIKYEIVDKIIKEFDAMHRKGTPFAGRKIRELITVNGVRVVLEDGSSALVRASSNSAVLVVVLESFSTRKLLYDLFDEVQSHLEKHGIRRENYDQLLPPYKGEE
ncbi:MAG: phosphomannomutase/phosphoglucomutase [archaeon]